MSRIFGLCIAAALGAALAQPAGAGARTELPISSYDDDPFVADAVLEGMSRRAFDRGADGRPILANDLVVIEDEPVIYRFDTALGRFVAFAWNPWLPDLVEANESGHFAFPDEERFPPFLVERGPDGKIVLVDGLQLWVPQDLHRGMTTAFEAAHAAKEAAELWAARELRWGSAGRLEINTHAYIDLNAFFSPSTQSLFFGVLPYRDPSGAPRIFETATSWDFAAHEAGHALYARLKPNHTHGDLETGAWSESFGDQIAMWASLRDPDRARALVEETGGDLAQSNAVTRLAEVFAALVGEGTGVRDAFHDKRVSDTDPQVHDRSEVFTGAAYRLFLVVYGELAEGRAAAEAASEAARVLGVFATRAADFMPENAVTLEDVGKAYLKVDGELFGGRYHGALVDELTRREIFDAGSLGEWLAHEAGLPALALPRRGSAREVTRWLAAHLDALAIGPDFGLALQSVVRCDARDGTGETIVRVQLTLGRGADAAPLDNHGVLVFRADGSLADYHAPLPPAEPAARLAAGDAGAEARSVVEDARRRGIDRHGAPLALVRRPDGRLAAEARVLRSEGIGAWLEVFTQDAPEGERREAVIPPVPADRSVPVAEELLE